jgi:hypothetical protein
VAVLLSLTLIMFADVLFTSKDAVLSLPGTDLDSQFTYWRDFGFTQLRHGNLALWNPHIFSGAPYLGGFQSALLYPPNLVYLILPLAKAINWGIALHVFLAGLFMYLWVSSRGLHPFACLLSSVLFMFGSTYFLHIFAGHLPNLCAMIWAPLILLCIDGICRQRSWGWCLGGMMAVTMSILAGHPQYFFYCFVTAAIYSFLSILRIDHRKTAMLQIGAIYAGAVALSAIQLFTGLGAGNESVRTGGLPYEVARTFSFPWANLLTLLTPKLFGDDLTLPYWGKWYFWEMNVFMSITGLLLAVYGAIYGDKRLRRFSVIMTFILVWMALGSYTPLYRVLYSWAPGFNRFRGISKFVFPASLFLLMLSAVGFDRLLRKDPVPRRVTVAALGTGIAFIALGLLLRFSVSINPMGLWHSAMMACYSPQGSYLPGEYYHDQNFILRAGLNASISIIVAAVTISLLGVLLLLSAYSKKLLYLVAVLGVVEIFLFARTTRPTIDMASTRMPEFERFLSEHPGDYRFVLEANPDLPMSIGGGNLWGSDPLVLRRYAEFMFFTQGINPDEASPYLHVARYNPLYKMLRCRYWFLQEGDRIRVKEFEDVMPHFDLISDYVVITNRDGIFAAMQDSSFDPRKKVILELNPNPLPVKSNENGTVTILDSSTDSCTLEAALPQPAILLMTDPYSDGWRARALSGSVQQKYDLLPANYIVRAIPLSAGHHQIRIEYLPKAYLIGKWVSIISVIIYAGLTGWYCLGSRARGGKTRQPGRLPGDYSQPRG